jgi:hypothetical protein
LQADFPAAALLASLVAGVLYWQVATRAMAWLSRHVPRPATAGRHLSSRSGEPSLAGPTG